MNYDGIMGKGTVRLVANAATTDVFHVAMSASNHVFLQARTSSAAADSPYISARAKRSFTITHLNTADTDKDFSYIIVAGDVDA